jgi:hypothetical protein
MRSSVNDRNAPAVPSASPILRTLPRERFCRIGFFRDPVRVDQEKTPSAMRPIKARTSRPPNSVRA